MKAEEMTHLIEYYPYNSDDTCIEPIYNGKDEQVIKYAQRELKTSNTMYYQNTELVSITFDDGLKDPGKKYMVYVNQPYYENGKSTFVVRQKETDKQYIFLETGSAKVAFNMVNRIVSGMRYPKAKMIW